MKSVVVILYLLFTQSSFCQVTFAINKLPDNHDYKKDIFISGNFEGWSGGQKSYKLTQNNNSYFITLPKENKTINFKFTLGSWAFVECTSNGNSIENRTYTFNKIQDTVDVTIDNWSDGKPKEIASTATKNVHVFAEDFKMPQLNRTRKISVYLPPDYETTTTRFPVLYIQDGQNMFDAATSFSGEWEVDETLNKLSKTKGIDIIVVAINHGDDKRINEYSPWDNSKYGKGEGNAYLEFLVHTLKPEIDKKYRTKTDAKNTAIMGSSMGGLISHYAGLKYPQVFGKVGVFSPSFWYSDESFSVTKNHAALKHTKMYYLAGGKEDETMVNNLEKILNIMKKNKFSQRNLYSKIVPDGTHSESFWKTEFGNAIEWLFLKN